MSLVNRSVVIIKPRQPYADWVNSLPEAGEERSEPITLEELHQDCTTLLAPEAATPADLQAFLEDIKIELFEMELETLTDNLLEWPRERTSELFDEWFELEIHTTVYDIVVGPLEREDDYDDELDLFEEDEDSPLLDMEDGDELSSLEGWEAYLRDTLNFPFQAEVAEGHGPLRTGERASVTAIADVDDRFGVIVTVRVRGRLHDVPLTDLRMTDLKSENYPAVEAYNTWMQMR